MEIFVQKANHFYTNSGDTKNGCVADYSPTQMLSGLYHVFVGEEHVTKP